MLSSGDLSRDSDLSMEPSQGLTMLIWDRFVIKNLLDEPIQYLMFSRSTTHCCSQTDH